MFESDKVVVNGNWLVPAGRNDIYAVISDFERMPERFPKVARSIKILSRNGNLLSMEAEVLTFGRHSPAVKVSIEAELLPGKGYRCTTRNPAFDTSGKEELLLIDDPNGTRVQYSYIITVRHRWLRPIFAWLTAKFWLPYWKRSFLDPVEMIVSQQSLSAQNETAASGGQRNDIGQTSK